jgi:hypothetical protein
VFPCKVIYLEFAYCQRKSANIFDHVVSQDFSTTCSIMGIQEHTDLDELFDKVGHNSSCTEGAVRVCRRIVYGDPCGTLVTSDPGIPHEECDRCGQMAVLCTGCSFFCEDSTCVEYEPACRYRQIAS